MKITCFSKISKVVIVFISICIVMSGVYVVIAEYTDLSSKFSGEVSGDVDGKVTPIIQTILNVVRIVGAGIAIIILMYIGAKFMMAAPSERANIKQYSMNYVIGAVILLGASGIITIIGSFAQRITQ